jgi:DNA invertase Pin-like site-specific DNA recombinase
MRAVIYARVSTDRQELETQLGPLRDFVSARKWELKQIYTDIVTGTKQRRPGLDGLMKAARLREIDVVVVARFDRFARSVSHLVIALEEFQALGISFVSLNESIDTSTPMGKMVFVVVAAVAELERGLIVERVRAGINRARKEGKVLGRPWIIFDRQRALDMGNSGESISSIARSLGVARSTVRHIIQSQKTKPIQGIDVRIPKR